MLAGSEENTIGKGLISCAAKVPSQNLGPGSTLRRLGRALARKSIQGIAPVIGKKCVLIRLVG